MQPRFSCRNMSSCKSGLTVNIVEIQSAYRDRISSSMKRTGPFQIFPPPMQSTGLTKTRVSSLFSLISSFELPLSRVMDKIDFFLFFLRNNVASYLRFSFDRRFWIVFGAAKLTDSFYLSPELLDSRKRL